MLTHQLISCIKREIYESSETFKISLKPGVLMIEHIKTNNVYFVTWNPFRGGTFQVLPCQNSELFDLVSHCVHRAVQIHNQQKTAAERKRETAKIK